ACDCATRWPPPAWLHAGLPHTCPVQRRSLSESSHPVPCLVLLLAPCWADKSPSQLLTSVASLQTARCARQALACFLSGRSASRMTNFRPYHVSSIAHTFTSTNPKARPILRTTSSVRSVGLPEAFLGQAIHNMPFATSWPARPRKSFSSAA